jgi:hypothetical protein
VLVVDIPLWGELIYRYIGISPGQGDGPRYSDIPIYRCFRNGEGGISK